MLQRSALLRSSLLDSWQKVRYQNPNRTFDRRLRRIALLVAKTYWSKEHLNRFGVVTAIELCRVLRDRYSCQLDDALKVGWWFGYTNYLIQIGYRDLSDEDSLLK